jgi:hypothetical protein
MKHTLKRSYQQGYAVHTDRVNDFGINVKVVVTENIAHTHNPFPLNAGISGKQNPVRDSVEVLHAFTDGDELHTDRISFLQTLV